MRNILLWNQAAVSKLAWHIYSMQESLWVKWVHGVYTKGGRWEIFNAPAIASWTIWKICVVTADFRNWICSSHYCIKEVYEHSLMRHHKVPWRHLVWNRISIPKTRFICWLVVRQGLKSKDKHLQLGVVVDHLCPLCGLDTETPRHLFFTCLFSRSCAKAVKEWIGIALKPFEFMDFRKGRLSKAAQLFMPVPSTTSGAAEMKRYSILL